LAGVIHDIGKIAVPADILSKPGALTANEFGIIKEHSAAGFDILKEIDFPWPIAEIVHQHHEKMDGSGYPKGLSGDAILLEARIVSISDVVEAMSSHRPYRPAIGIEKALDEMREYRGIRYDPDAVDACIKVFAKTGFKFA
jgi:HD-GYP domain-containing protein (c-di-GMP phosphodiesterase class II)